MARAPAASCLAFSSDRAFFPFVFLFNAARPTQIYTLSLHDALPISRRTPWLELSQGGFTTHGYSILAASSSASLSDRKSTRLNSSHTVISYAVFCLKKKNNASPSD